MKVQNMTGRTGRPVANQFEIYDKNGKWFQSYRSMIAFKPYGDGKIMLDENYWDYSVTTGKYRNQFLRETKDVTEYKIKTSEYILTDLNK